MHPWLAQMKFAASLRIRRGLRSGQNLVQRGHFARELRTLSLPHLVKRHESPIFRNLPDVDRSLFANKKVNLEIAVRGLQGIVIRPGQVFSLWHLVKAPTAKRGFLQGMGIQRGRPVATVGGGLCQLSNAIFWLALHSDLEVIERHHHSLDLFPDDHRLVPFGTGATIVYNFKDLRLRNASDREYQLHFSVDEETFSAELRCSHSPEFQYAVSERDHAFVTQDDGLYRKNTIVRERSGNPGHSPSTEILFQNFAKCLYSP